MPITDRLLLQHAEIKGWVSIVGRPSKREIFELRKGGGSQSCDR
jgi:hypothetical protein